MVIFGAPLTEGTKDDACRAVRCAQEMLAAVDRLERHQTTRRLPLKIGIGIHTGQVTQATWAHQTLGIFRNRRSRKPGLSPGILTKEFQTSLVLSTATWEQVHDQFPTIP